MAELNKSNFTEEFHIDLHGSSNELNRLAIGHINLFKCYLKYIYAMYLI